MAFNEHNPAARTSGKESRRTQKQIQDKAQGRVLTGLIDCTLKEIIITDKEMKEDKSMINMPTK
jgi:hypothetical protein